MSMRTLKLMSFLSLVAVSGLAQAKGLDELSQDNPDSEIGAGDEDKGSQATGEGAKSTAPMVKSETSKALTDKLFVGTSFGWVKASKSEGEFTGGGMSDFTVGYKFASNLAGT